ncbi:hypothetical protein QWJ41_21035, partial [Nocardioides sp. SOB44]
IARTVALFTSSGHTSSALQPGFGHDSGEAAHQVAPSVDQDRLFAKTRQVSTGREFGSQDGLDPFLGFTILLWVTLGSDFSLDLTFQRHFR